jgi:hypothetical protein
LNDDHRSPRLDHIVDIAPPKDACQPLIKAPHPEVKSALVIPPPECSEAYLLRLQDAQFSIV